MLSSGLALPVLKELIPHDIEYGTILLVEFGPDSMWFETSLTIAAQPLRSGIRTQYLTFQRMPMEIRRVLASFGLDVKKLENDNVLQIIDCYTAQTGLGISEEDPSITLRSLKLSDWSIRSAQSIKRGYPAEGRRWLNIEDNGSILSKYNSENAIIEYWRTRNIPETRVSEDIIITSLLTGTVSDMFRNQFEALHDGIIDFKSEEKEGRMQQLVRVRKMRGGNYDTRWRGLRVLDNGEVELTD